MKHSIEWEVAFIVLTCLFPIWIFTYHPISNKPFQTQVEYHILSFPFYLVQYFLLYCFIADFVISAACESSTSLFCENNYSSTRYLSLYVSIVLLFITMISQIIDAIYKPSQKKRKKRADIRKSVENAYYNMLGKSPSVKRNVDKEIKRRMKKFQQGRRSSRQQLDLISQVQMDILMLQESDLFEPLVHIYNSIDAVAEESEQDKNMLENDLYEAFVARIKRTPSSVSFVTLQTMIMNIRNLQHRQKLLVLMNAYASRRRNIL